MTAFISTDVVFFDNVNGSPAALGTVYFGKPNTDPEVPANAKAPYTDYALTTPTAATQSLTTAGKLSTRLYLNGAYSITVNDADGVQIFNDPYVTALGSGGGGGGDSGEWTSQVDTPMWSAISPDMDGDVIGQRAVLVTDGPYYLPDPTAFADGQRFSILVVPDVNVTPTLIGTMVQYDSAGDLVAFDGQLYGGNSYDLVTNGVSWIINEVTSGFDIAQKYLSTDGSNFANGIVRIDENLGLFESSGSLLLYPTDSVGTPTGAPYLTAGPNSFGYSYASGVPLLTANSSSLNYRNSSAITILNTSGTALTYYNDSGTAMFSCVDVAGVRTSTFYHDDGDIAFRVNDLGLRYDTDSGDTLIDLDSTEGVFNIPLRAHNATSGILQNVATSGDIVAAPVTSVAGKTGVVTLVKGDVGLGNVDNTTDLNKPISTATQTALNAKLANVVEDTTPQLGGNLDVNGFDITSTSAVELATNGTVRVAVTDTYTTVSNFLQMSRDNPIFTLRDTVGSGAAATGFVSYYDSVGFNLGNIGYMSAATTDLNVQNLSGDLSLRSAFGETVRVTDNGVRTIAGTAALPSQSYIGDPDTGWYSAGANNISGSIGGVRCMSLGATGLYTVSGTAALPAASFLSDTDTGAYLAASNSYGISTGGVARAIINSTAVTFASASYYLTSIGTTASAANMFIDSGTGQVLRSTSSGRYKQNVVDVTPEQADVVLQLCPRTYNPLPDFGNPEETHYGFIAEEVSAVEPKLASYKDYDDGNGPIPEAVQYERVTVILTAKVQEQEARIQALEKALLAMKQL